MAVTLLCRNVSRQCTWWIYCIWAVREKITGKRLTISSCFAWSLLVRLSLSLSPTKQSKFLLLINLTMYCKNVRHMLAMIYYFSSAIGRWYQNAKVISWSRRYFYYFLRIWFFFIKIEYTLKWPKHMNVTNHEKHMV